MPRATLRWGAAAVLVAGALVVFTLRGRSQPASTPFERLDVRSHRGSSSTARRGSSMTDAFRRTWTPRPTFAPSGAGAGPRGTPTESPPAQREEELQAKIGEGGPDAAGAAQQLARLVAEQGRTDEATAAYAKAAELHRDHQGERSLGYAEVLAEHAALEANAGRLEQALSLLDRMLQAVSDEPGTPDASPDLARTRQRARAQARYARASVLRRLGRNRDALTEVERASKESSDPKEPRWVDLHGALLVETGKLEEALVLYDDALKGESVQDGEASNEKPSRFDLGRAEALVDLGRYEDALTALEGAYAALGPQEESTVDPRLRPRIEFALAQALRGTGGDEVRVRALAEAAREAWAQGGDQLSQDRLGRIEAFVAE